MTTEITNPLPETWEAAAQLQGVDPNALPDVSMIPERLKKFTVGMYKRAIVVEALNKAAGLTGEKRWKPDYTNDQWDKNYPWGVPGKDDKVPSGFGFSGTTYDHSNATTHVGSRLELRESDLVDHMWENFRELLIDTMLIPQDEE
jgi:hypothetical protein